MLSTLFVLLTRLHLDFLSSFYSRKRIFQIRKLVSFSISFFPSLFSISHHSSCNQKGLYHLFQEKSRPFFLTITYSKWFLMAVVMSCAIKAGLISIPVFLKSSIKDFFVSSSSSQYSIAYSKPS